MRYVGEERAEFCRHCRLRARNIYAYSYAQSTVSTKVPTPGAFRSFRRRRHPVRQAPGKAAPRWPRSRATPRRACSPAGWFCYP
jgi:hypothetical protein